MDDCLVEVRIEVGAERVDRGHPALAQEVQHLLVDQLDALAQRVGVRGRRLQGALEVVHDRENLGQDVRLRVVGKVAPFAVDPLAVVVELGRRAEQAVLQRVLFAPQFLERVGLRLRRLRVLIVECLFVS